MPGTAELEGRRVSYCPVCLLAYDDEAIAGKCEAFCTEHSACSLELTAHAVGSVAKPGEPSQ